MGSKYRVVFSVLESYMWPGGNEMILSQTGYRHLSSDAKYVAFGVLDDHPW